jgi:hypothetical protein
MTRTRIAILTVAALGLAGAAAMTTQLDDSNSLDGSLNGVPYALAQAVDEAEASRASTEVIRLDTDASAGAGPAGAASDDSILPTAEEISDTISDIASTVGDTLAAVGECLLEQLPAVFSSGAATDTTVEGTASAASACADLLPGPADVGAIDLGALDLTALDLADLDVSGLDELATTDLGLPSDFDLGDIDLTELTDELADIADLDLAELDVGGEVLDVVSDVADEVVEFFEELPGNVRERFDGLFGD